MHAAFDQEFFEITIGNGVANLEEHLVKDHILRIVTALEIYHTVSACCQNRHCGPEAYTKDDRKFATLPAGQGH